MRTVIGLALSGGGVKGLAHFGVIKVIKEYGIPVQVVTGSSMGAIVASLYALDPSLELAQRKIKEIVEKDTFKKMSFNKFVKNQEDSSLKKMMTSLKKSILSVKMLFTSYVVEGSKLKQLVEDLFENYDFKDTKLKLGIMVLDVKTGQEVIVTAGKILDAVLASISIPGVFQPVEEEGKILVDGASVSYIPVSAAKDMGANFIIASDVARDFCEDAEPHTGWQLQFRIDQIAKHKLAENELSKAEITIFPEVRQLSWSEFEKIDFCIQKGEEAARAVLKDWQKVLRKNRIKRWFSFGS